MDCVLTALATITVCSSDDLLTVAAFAAQDERTVLRLKAALAAEGEEDIDRLLRRQLFGFAAAGAVQDDAGVLFGEVAAKDKSPPPSPTSNNTASNAAYA